MRGAGSSRDAPARGRSDELFDRLTLREAERGRLDGCVEDLQKGTLV